MVKQPETNFLEQLKKSQERTAMRRQESIRKENADGNMNFLQTPQGGMSKVSRESIRGSPVPEPRARPLPAGGRPKPAIKKAPEKPKVKAMFDYTQQDTDEISLVVGEIVELVREG